MSAQKKRTRRSPEQMIEDLQQEIERLKNRAAQARAKKDPALRHINAAVRSIDKAASETADGATRKALGEARATLAACLELSGASAPRTGGSGARSPAVEPKAILAHLAKHPGSSGEDIAAALGTDTKGLRPTMKKLIDAGQVRTKGKARGMRYFPAGRGKVA